MQLYLLLSIFLGGLVSCQGLILWDRSSKASEDSRLFKAQKTNVTQVPYMVHIGAKDASNKSYTCGGSILDKNNILTACHCVYNMVSIEVRIGSSSVNSGGKVYSVSKSQIICHNLFDSETKAYDVAILKFFKALDLKSVNASAVVLSKNTTAVPKGTVVRVSGWGYQSDESTDEITNLTLPDYLGSKTVAVVDQDYCKQKYNGSNIYISSRQFCTGADGNGSITITCYGDAGNPAVLEDPSSNQFLQVGLASFGRGCGSLSYPAIYSQIARFYCWIVTLT